MEITISQDFDVHCKCGADLEAKESKGCIYVEPCIYCMEEAEKKGQEEEAAKHE